MDERAEVALGCRVLAAAGLGDMIWGHLSLRSSTADGLWMKSAGYGLEEMRPELIVRIDQDGTLLEGSEKVHIEFPIHTEILAARPEVNAVIHCHPAAAIAFGVTGRVLRPISHEGTLFTPPDIPRFTLTGDLIHSRELGAALAKSLGQSNAILMHNHGIAVVGETVGKAVMTAILLERACEIQLRAEAGGGVQNWSDDQEALDKRARCWSPTQLERGWAYLARNAPDPPDLH